MYHMQPVNPVDVVCSLPTCMYTMKNLHMDNTRAGISEITTQTTNLNIMAQEPLPELAQLECQQEEILKKLSNLKEQILSFRRLLSEPIEKKSAVKVSLPLGTAMTSIVVFTSPENPPYSLLALRKVWNGCLSISSHSHSTLNKPVPLALLQKFNLPGDNDKHQVHVTVIWKQVGSNLQLVLSPLRNVVLQGEVTLLRLLSHLGPVNLSLENLPPEEAAIADFILDLVYQLSQNSSSKKTLVSNLGQLQCDGKGCLLHNNAPGLVDIALWSYFQSKGAAPCPPNLKKWFDTCSSTFK